MDYKFILCCSVILNLILIIVLLVLILKRKENYLDDTEIKNKIKEIDSQLKIYKSDLSDMKSIFSKAISKIGDIVLSGLSLGTKESTMMGKNKDRIIKDLESKIRNLEEERGKLKGEFSKWYERKFY